MFMPAPLLNITRVILNETTRFQALEKNASSSCDDRTIWTIVRSCLTTISFVTWVAAHPNMTGPNSGAFAGSLARGLIALEALLIPELIIAWAMQQWLVAHKSVMDVNDPKWTISHAYLLSMGGFMLQDCPERVTNRQKKSNPIDHPLCPDEFLFLLRMAYIDIPQITEREIKDKSKGDLLSKALTVLQTSWFVIQCIARRAQGLPVTELELVTVAFALTNTATYLFWWNKPLNVHCHVLVQLKRPISKRDWLWCMLYIRGPQLENEESTLVEYEGDTEDSEDAEDVKFGQMIPDLVTASKGGREWPIILFESIRTSLSNECRMRTTKKQVHRQYSGDLPQPLLLVTFLISGLFAVTFGAIHCLAWTSSFPTNTERILWRVCCMVMIGIPCWLAVVFGLINLFPVSLYPLRMGIRKSVTVVRCLYILARVTILVEMFVSLRSLSPAVYEAVHWTTFIPHV